MLVLTRRVGETLVIGQDITVTVTEIRSGQVRLAIKAPNNVEVDRHEIRERKNADRTLEAAEAQAQGGGEVDKAVEDAFRHGTGVLKVEHVPHGEFTAPPRAPVGVVAEAVDFLRDLLRFVKLEAGKCESGNDRHFFDSQAKEIERVIAALAQQPAAVDGVLIAAMEDGFTFQKPLPAPYMTDEANEQRAWVVERNRPPFCDESGVSVWAGPTPQEALACARRALAAQPGGGRG